MNTTISRIAAAAPLAVALLGFGIGSAHAAPYDPSSADKVQMQPAGTAGHGPDLPISDDLPDGDPPVDPDDIGPADPADEPADEPAEEPAEDDSNDEESDDAARTPKVHNGGTRPPAAPRAAPAEPVTDSDKDEAGDEAEQTPVEAADVQVTPVSAAGVQVPTGLVASAGVALAGVVGWAVYRRTKAFATA